MFSISMDVNYALFKVILLLKSWVKFKIYNWKLIPLTTSKHIHIHPYVFNSTTVILKNIKVRMHLYNCSFIWITHISNHSNMVYKRKIEKKIKKILVNTVVSALPCSHQLGALWLMGTIHTNTHPTSCQLISLL